MLKIKTIGTAACILFALSLPTHAASVKKMPASVENKKSLSMTSSAAARIASWNISGSIAASNKGQGWSASLNWTQRGLSQYQIRLSGPVGSGSVIITKNGSLVTVRDGAKSASSSNAGALLKQQTGISLPVNSMYYWVRGIPAPGAVQAIQRDQYGRILMLRQNGYTIEYNQYTAAGRAVLPSNMKLQGNGVFIKLVIRNWQV